MKLYSLLLITFMFALSPQSVFGWGEQGHHILCEAATRLVKNPELATFLQKKNHMMGHLCNIPDINWKRDPNLPGYDIINSYAHGMNFDKVYGPIRNVPTDFDNIKKDLIEKNLDPYRKGSLWWRARQFYLNAISSGKKAAESDVKTNEGNELIKQMMIEMGIMGHFVGDASMPLHNSADYDAWESEHGGLHTYFETEAVSATDLDLVYDVFSKARKFNEKQFVSDFIDNMKNISIQATDQMETLFKKDPILEKSKIIKDELGKTTKIEAKRESSDRGARVYRKLIIQQLALSAAYLAHFWDDIYIKAGKPDLSKFNLKNQYPLEIPVVPLNY